jgi:hypothetical protein
MRDGASLAGETSFGRMVGHCASEGVTRHVSASMTRGGRHMLVVGVGSLGSSRWG